MATSNPTIDFTHTTDAQFRAWGSAVSTALQAVGLIKTADTGQINWTTVTRPAANTAAGYEIFRFNDALQATKPIFVKVEYGTGNTTTVPGLFFTVGTATNGAGTLSGALSARQTPASTVTWNQFVQAPYFCCDGSGLVLCISAAAPATANGAMCVVIIERTRNTDGTPNGDGYFFQYFPGAGSAGSLGYTATGEFVGNTVTGATGSAATTNVANSSFAFSSGFVGTDTYVWPVAVAIPKPQAASKMLLVAAAGAGMRFNETVQIDHLGATHTYKCLLNQLGSYAQLGSTAIPLMLWE